MRGQRSALRAMSADSREKWSGGRPVEFQSRVLQSTILITLYSQAKISRRSEPSDFFRNDPQFSKKILINQIKNEFVS